MATQRQQSRFRRKKRIRKKVAGTAERPRLTVFRSNKHIYAQVIDDLNGRTLCAASSTAKSLTGDLEGKTKSERAAVVGAASSASSLGR